jgi:uncharacterized membrane protein YeiB
VAGPGLGEILGMTQLEPVSERSPAPPGPLAEPAAPVEAGPSTARLIGVDLARALAVFGMYVVHIGPPLSATSGVASWIRYLADGRSAILFATLAGFSVALIAGRREPKTGLAGRQARTRIAIRAVVLLAVGTAMAMVFGDVIILNFYGVYFLVALPLVRLGARTLAIIAAVLAVVAPQLAFVLSALLTEPVQQSINAYDPLERLCGVGVVDLLLTGFYPAITWSTFVIAGMALARLDLAAGAVRRRLAVFAPALIVLGYGMSWLLAGKDALRSTAEDMSGSSGSGSFGSGSLPPRGSASSLLLAGPHSGTSFDIIGSLGVAITVILCAMVAVDRLPWLRRLAKPVIAVGTMSLTAYVGHFVLTSFTGLAFKDSWVPLLMYVGGAIVFAGIWSRFFRRGPLEYLLHTATKPAKFVR